MRAQPAPGAGREDQVLCCQRFSIIATGICFTFFVVAGTIAFAGDSLSDYHFCDVIKWSSHSPSDAIVLGGQSRFSTCEIELAMSGSEPRPAIEAVKNHSDGERSVITSYDLLLHDPEPYLWDIHRKERRNKNITGALCLVAAGLDFWAAAGYPGAKDYSSTVDDNNSSTLNYGMGGIMLAAGFYELLSGTPAKNKLAKITPISDPTSRKRAGFQALESLNALGNGRRVISGGLMTLGAVVFLAVRPLEESEQTFASKKIGKKSPFNYIIGAAFGIEALISFCSKSAEENGYDNYLKAAGKKKGASLQMGFGFHKNQQLWAILRF